MNKKFILLMVLWFVCAVAMVAIAHADDGVLVSTTTQDDSEDWNVAEYSLPINNQHRETAALETEGKVVAQEEVKKETPIVPTGYSILVKDEMVTYDIHPDVSMWVRVKCEKIAEKQATFQADIFDVIHGQHEAKFKAWREAKQ